MAVAFHLSALLVACGLIAAAPAQRVTTGCQNDPKAKVFSEADLHKRMKQMATVPELQWKLKKTIATLSDEEIAKCGGCVDASKISNRNVGGLPFTPKWPEAASPTPPVAAAAAVTLHEPEKAQAVEKTESAITFVPARNLKIQPNPAPQQAVAPEAPATPRTESTAQSTDDSEDNKWRSLGKKMREHLRIPFFRSYLQYAESETEKPRIKKIYYINAPNQTLRQNKITEILKKTSRRWDRMGKPDEWIDVERWEATVRKDAGFLKIREFTQKGMEAYVVRQPPQLQKATMAIYLSQARLLKHIYEQDPKGEEWYVIFEDDTWVPDDWTAQVLKLLREEVPEDVDMFKFGYWGEVRCQDFVSKGVVEPAEPYHGSVSNMQLHMGNQAYMVRPKSIPKILSQLASMPLIDVDGALGNHHKEVVTTDSGVEKTHAYNMVQYLSGFSIAKHSAYEGSLRLEGNTR